MVLLWEAVGGATLADSAVPVLPDSTAEAFISLACLGGGEKKRDKWREKSERERERERERDIQCLPILLVYSPKMAIESRLAVKSILASSNWALELLRLTMDGLDVH